MALCNGSAEADRLQRPDSATLLQHPFMQDAAKMTGETLLDLFVRVKGRQPSSSDPSDGGSGESPYSSLEREKQRQQQQQQHGPTPEAATPRVSPGAQHANPGPTKGLGASLSA